MQINRMSKIVGQRVQELRHGRWSQAELAVLLGHRMGKAIDPTTITRLEKGNRPVTVDELAALAQILNVEPEDLMSDPDVIQREFNVWERMSALLEKTLPRLAEEIESTKNTLEICQDLKEAWDILARYRAVHEPVNAIQLAAKLMMNHRPSIFYKEDLTDHRVPLLPIQSVRTKGVSAFDLLAALSDIGVDGGILNRSWSAAVVYSVDTTNDDMNAPRPAEVFLTGVLAALEMRRSDVSAT